ncbi:hypothetical protein PAXRUDRAFT_665889 [Paxillus rubicundulus Ve08.2h10]|uniref:Uncharacterized protein n=1 Tax=Paxillus rubicundulus Ve08.2h10 TaxID=930991 RepID=A0A0D0D2R1_9AGAM|nr:hypothetical protein PAXRUDRAFT_665889 [Paxillus rubicundulus Ve08.2h10]
MTHARARGEAWLCKARRMAPTQTFQTAKTGRSRAQMSCISPHSSHSTSEKIVTKFLNPCLPFGHSGCRAHAPSMENTFVPMVITTAGNSSSDTYMKSESGPSHVHAPACYTE